MNHIAAALILFGLGTYAGMRTGDSYRGGAMPLLAMARTGSPLFDRVRAPALFWAATAANLAVAAGLTLGGIVVLAAGGRA